MGKWRPFNIEDNTEHDCKKQNGSESKKKPGNPRSSNQETAINWDLHKRGGINETMNSILDAIYLDRNNTNCSKCGEYLENPREEICDWCKVNNNE